jgi:hypothetical protein
LLGWKKNPLILPLLIGNGKNGGQIEKNLFDARFGPVIFIFVIWL